MHTALAKRFPPQGGSGDLHHYHAANSICSQKVRLVLGHLNIAHQSHEMALLTGDTYDPEYVRLRAEGCRQAELPFAQTHLGTTSVSAAGCDACVVPTLVDARTEQVIIDSHAICNALDQRCGSPLTPEAYKTQIAAELEVIDHLPNYQVLAITLRDPDAPITAFADGKVARCTQRISENPQDHVLVAAYAAKRDKEAMAAQRLFDDNAMARARDAINDALVTLETRLDGAGPFLFGVHVTMADLFWAAELIRCIDLDQTPWDHGVLPNVAAYSASLMGLSSVQHGILNHPGARF
jgi:2,5-dichlorohydroquinone reductive dechlorinase